MKLRKQLFTAFIVVAIIPLFLTCIYLFGTNMKLTFDLYRKNLETSTEIQVGLLEEHLYKLMIRANRFTTVPAIGDACASDSKGDVTVDERVYSEIVKFTDETLDSVAVFALVSQDGRILYSSGSNLDMHALETQIQKLEWGSEQKVCEMELSEGEDSLAILTPVVKGTEQVGGFLVVYRADYLLKTISGHKQIESSNAFIYCLEHQETVIAKTEENTTIADGNEFLKEQDNGNYTRKLGKEDYLFSFQRFSKTPWVLVNNVAVRQVFAPTVTYLMISIPLLIIIMITILLLSGRASKRILKPLDILLRAVERFFLSGAQDFLILDLDPKTEIGYLATKFNGMSNEITTAQKKLKERNYLYKALLSATYELRIIVNLKEDTLSCSMSGLSDHLESLKGRSASERLLQFLWDESMIKHESGNYEVMRDIAYGNLFEPAETEICCVPEDNHCEEPQERWYRLIAVPIIEQDKKVQRVVLHFENITDRKGEELRLLHSSQTDPLCGLLNKKAFLSLSQGLSCGKEAAVFFIDLDQFKQVNDTFGHAVGDEVLIAAARAIQSQFRSTDLIGRYGGDEFIVLAPGLSLEKVRIKAAALLDVLSFEYSNAQITIHVTGSIGVCTRNVGEDIGTAIKMADEAMYYAKQNGKAQYFIKK